MLDLAGVRDAGLGDQFVVPVQVQRAVFQAQFEEVVKVLGIQLAGVDRGGGGEIHRTDHAHTVGRDNRLAGLSQLAVAAGFRGDVDDHRTGFHAFDHRLGDDARRLAPRHGSGGDDDVHALDVLGQCGLLLGALIGRQLARVAARTRGADAKLDVFRAERLDLFLGFRAHVEAFYLRAQAPRRGDRLQTRDTRADDQHLRRPHRARSGGQHREEFRRGLGGDQHRFVAGDIGLR